MASLSDITVAISTNISNFQKGLDRAQRRLQKAGKGFKEAGTTMSQSLTLPLAAAGAGAVKAASDFEDAVAEIRKVSDQETASKLAGQIRQMATEIPLAQSEIANLAADAARFGVSGSKNIQQFTKTVAQMSFTTDLSAQEAGRSLAKIADQTDTPISEIDRLGSTIVKLGDNMATSQNEIVKAMSRGAIAARNFGLSGQEIAGLSARINEVSESSERAGTRLRRVFQELANPKTVEKVAQALDMTASEFKALRDSSPQKALTAVVEKISQGGAEGKKMANIFATSSRAALRGLASDTQALNEALGMARNEFKANGELSRQAAIQQQKFSNQLQLALNRLRNVAITIGNKLMPFVLDLVNAIQRGISAFSGLSSRMQDIIIVGAGIAAALGPVLFIFGFFVSSVLPGLSAVGGALGSITAIINPVGLAFAGAAALIVTNWEQVKAFFQGLGIVQAIKNIGSVLRSTVEIIVGLATLLVSKLSQLFDGASGTFRSIGQRFTSVITNIFQTIQTVFSGIIDFVLTWGKGLFDIFRSIGRFVNGDTTEAFRAFKDGMKNIFLGILSIVESVINGILNQFESLAQGLGIDSIADGLKTAQEEVTNLKKDIIENLGMQKQADDVERYKNNVLAAGSALENLGEKAVSSFSFPSLGGGGAGGSQEDQGKDKPSLPQLVGNFSKDMQQQGGSQGQGESDIISQGTLRKAIALNERLIQQRRIKQQQQRKMQMLSQQTGEALGRSLGRVQKALGASFSAIITGQKKASKAFQNFGKTVGNIFQKLLTQLIQMVIKMLAIKAITAVITGGGSGLLSGISGGSFGGQLLQGIGGIGSGLIGGNNSNNDQGGGPVFGTARGDELSIVQRRRNRENSKIGTDKGPG
jgi:TP901 family phage tail tape measure protein